MNRAVTSTDRENFQSTANKQLTKYFTGICLNVLKQHYTCFQRTKVFKLNGLNTQYKLRLRIQIRVFPRLIMALFIHHTGMEIFTSANGKY